MNWNFKNEEGEVYGLDLESSKLIGINTDKEIILNEHELNYFKMKAIERHGEEESKRWNK